MKKNFLYFTLLGSPLAFADSLPEPTGRVILTVSGNVTQGQTAGEAKYDLKMLQALPQTTYKMTTRWHDSEHTFVGPLLKDVIDSAGARAKKFNLIALNDYLIDIEYDYIKQYQPILAWQDNGKKMRVRDKGPLWLILPQHLYPELNSEDNTGKMIWQLHRIETD